MEIEELICSLEQSKQLKRLGVSDHSSLVWIEHKDRAPYPMGRGEQFFLDADYYAAYTSAELALLINKHFDENYKDGWYQIYFRGEANIVFNPNWLKLPVAMQWVPASNNEAEARGEFLIYLLEKPVSCKEPNNG